ncbi:hypothetical protein JKL49_11115 [Phenylobacterium sp. 20VBR1]|uniref:Uncharacterized protein n=1 Tax=Phenylobacterium glaciei TaxID=2803784 RepID=A0A941HVM0_9CAUL|nr:hypothetical protein [Phenylobacterium glaciei]MBR7619939.1 hypothetical protein [Phenylobacterium glaciei]
MDYIPIQPGRRRTPGDLILMCVLEVVLALAAAWVSITRVPPEEIMDHRQLIVTLTGNTLPFALLICPLLAWVAFARRADGAIWPLLWTPALWAVLILAGAL